MNNKQLRSLASVLPGVALVTLILTISMFISVQAKGTDANLTINKTADPLAYSGSTVTFTIAVTNTSGTMLTSVVTSDPLAPLCDRVIGELGSTSYSYNCSLSGKTADFSNSVTVTGILLGVGVVSDTDTVFVSVINPDINIDKTADPTTILAEETVVYTYTVTNPGDDALTAVLVTDDKCSPVSGPAIISGNGNSTLDPGEIWAYTCSTALTVDTTNTATVTGTDSLDGTVDDSDTAFVNVIAPAIEIAKTPDVQIVNSGEDVDFTLTVSNTGDVELSGVTVTDEQCDTLTGPSGDDGDGVLQTTENWTYSCAVNNVTDGFINSATVTGTHPLAGIVTDADAAKVLLADTLTCPTDMFAYWRLDEPSGGTTFDDSYNGHDAVCATGRCPSTVPGIINNAQAFDGSDEVNVPYVPGDDSLNWGVNDSFSIEFWIKRPGTPTGNEVVVGRQGPTHPRPHIWVGPAKTSGNAVFCLYDTSGTGSCIKGNSAVTGGDWHHVVAVRDANLGQNRIYVDGVLEGSVVKTYSAGFDTTTPLNIGWLNLDPYYHFSGALDEVALYDRALSPTEIQQHYYQVLSVGRHYCEASPFAPVIFSTPVTEATVQRPYTYDVDAIGNPVPTYTLTITPAGMTIDTETGFISWKPLAVQQGSHPVEVEARNSEGSDVQSFTINVAEGPLCPADMFSYWKLDEISGTTYVDLYSGNDGACPGGIQCPSPAPGQVDGAQAFDGSNTQINVPAAPSFNWAVDDSFSIEFWMRRPGTPPGENEIVVGRQGSMSSNPHIWVGAAKTSGKAVFCLIDTSGTGSCATGDTAVTGGAWHHIVAVRDASFGQNHIYVDGVLEDAVSQTYSAGFEATTALNIGWLNLAPYYHFSGSIDEVALYNRALSLTEIQQHRDRGLAGYGYCVIPEIAISKKANSTTIYAGELVTYTYTVTNTGDDTLSNVSVSDDQCSPVTLAQGDNELDPDEFSTYRCSMNLDQDTTNQATAMGTHSLGEIVSDTSTAFVNVINPQITIEKQVDPTTIYPGELVNYTYAVDNAGDDPLSNVSVSDDRCSPVTLTGGDSNLDNVLDLAETWTFACATTLSVDTTNTATATAADSLDKDVSDTDTAFVNVINPEIAIDKQADPTTTYPGGLVNYTYTVVNAGDDPLSNVSVSDDRCSPVIFTGGDSNSNTILDLVETWSYSCSTNVFTNTINTATVTGVDSLDKDVNDTDTAFVSVSQHEVYLPLMLSFPGD